MSAGKPGAAVLFDLDGTLVDTPGAMTGVLRAVVAEHGMAIRDDRLRATVGRPLVASFALLLDLAPGDPAAERAADRARALFTREVVPRAEELVLPGAVELLEHLRAEGRGLAVVTSKVRASAVELLRATRLIDHFDVLACHGMTPCGKPQPDLALLAARELGAAPADCLVVGDAVDDVYMARAAGMPVVGVLSGVATEAELREAGALDVRDGVAALLPATRADRRGLTADPTAPGLAEPGPTTDLPAPVHLGAQG
ncbi:MULTISPECIES: HAD family hydrolase [Actinosynnema]|uniref:HAD family hydrolase n=1 Tax=Actinosynnema TaxID=40566 RepID=UPI0020A40945|nr:HAD family hydrolase [Actinosynnema pretiosum]MCP2092463.1 phosphoglycolate phosphatase [Actinosynnema pretiosum]